MLSGTPLFIGEKRGMENIQTGLPLTKKQNFGLFVEKLKLTGNLYIMVC